MRSLKCGIWSLDSNLINNSLSNAYYSYIMWACHAGELTWKSQYTRMMVLKYNVFILSLLYHIFVSLFCKIEKNIVNCDTRIMRKKKRKKWLPTRYNKFTTFLKNFPNKGALLQKTWKIFLKSGKIEKYETWKRV